MVTLYSQQRVRNRTKMCLPFPVPKFLGEVSSILCVFLDVVGLEMFFTTLVNYISASMFSETHLLY